MESFTDEDHHHEKDDHDDGHGFGFFKAVFQPRAHRFVRSADAEAGYGGYGGFGGLGGFGGIGGLYGGGLYGHGYGKIYLDNFGQRQQPASVSAMLILDSTELKLMWVVVCRQTPLLALK